MIKLFLRLYSIILIAVVVFVIGVANLDKILDVVAENYLGELSEGTVRLANKTLHDRPRDEWQGFIDLLNEGGGYPLSLRPEAQLDLPPEVIERMGKKSVAVHRFEGALHGFKKIKDSDLVLVIPFEQSDYENSQRMANSTFNLLLMSLSGKPQALWPEIITELGRGFNFPVELVELSGLDLQGRAYQDLIRGRVATRKIDEEEEYHYRVVPGSDYVIKIGPFEGPMLFSYLRSILISSLALMVAFAVLVWVYPLWRDLRHLGRSARLFGEGQLDARALLPKRSVLYRLAGTFDGMADRIQGLISSHKELTNSVSHELRTPIARLRFGMEMLQGSSDGQEQARYLQSMQADIDELDTLVAELLTYARFDRQTPDLDFKRQKIAPWLDSVLESETFEMAGVALSCRLDVAIERADARFEPRLMARALHNLVQNAGRYAKKAVHVAFTRNATHCMISVDDDGPGIPPDKREAVFEAFTRLDVSRERGTGGYGLGLAIVNRIAQWHGGHVSVQVSELGGARFMLEWPSD